MGESPKICVNSKEGDVRYKVVSVTVLVDSSNKIYQSSDSVREICTVTRFDRFLERSSTKIEFTE